MIFCTTICCVHCESSIPADITGVAWVKRSDVLRYSTATIMNVVVHVVIRICICIVAVVIRYTGWMTTMTLLYELLEYIFDFHTTKGRET
jgi:hypothetical protein